MLIILKLCVTVSVLVTGAGAQVDICDANGAELMANSAPQVLTAAEKANARCEVHIMVPAGSSLKLTFTSIGHAGYDPIGIYGNDSSFIGNAYTLATGPSVYIIPGSAFVAIKYNEEPFTTFVMEYQQVPFEREENICNVKPRVYATTTVRELVTPNFGNGPYFDDAFCEVVIQSNVTGASEVKVEVTSFDIECGYDSVDICDGVRCQDVCDTNERIFRGNFIRVCFSSDESKSLAGMRLEYVTDLSDWTPWVSQGGCEYRDCRNFVRDTRRRDCLIDTCMDEPVQERTRVCSEKCDDCLLR